MPLLHTIYQSPSPQHFVCGEVTVEMEGEERRGRVEGKLEPRSVDVTLEIKRGENRG